MSELLACISWSTHHPRAQRQSRTTPYLLLRKLKRNCLAARSATNAKMKVWTQLSKMEHSVRQAPLPARWKTRIMRLSETELSPWRDSEASELYSFYFFSVNILQILSIIRSLNIANQLLRKTTWCIRCWAAGMRGRLDCAGCSEPRLSKCVSRRRGLALASSCSCWRFPLLSHWLSLL